MKNFSLAMIIFLSGCASTQTYSLIMQDKEPLVIKQGEEIKVTIKNGNMKIDK